MLLPALGIKILVILCFSWAQKKGFPLSQLTADSAKRIRYACHKSSRAIALGRRQADLKVAYQLIDDMVCMSTSQFSSYPVTRSVKAIQFLLLRHSEEEGCEDL